MTGIMLSRLPCAGKGRLVFFIGGVSVHFLSLKILRRYLFTLAPFFTRSFVNILLIVVTRN